MRRPADFARAALVLALAPALASCPEPRPYGGPIPVDTAGVAARFASLCRVRPGGAAAGLCPESAPPARARRLAGGDGLRGGYAIGRAGDVLVENDEIAFVVDQLGQGIGFEISGGVLVDVADANARVDELGALFPRTGEFPRQPANSELAFGVDVEGVASVVVRGRDLDDAHVVVSTTYSLRPGERLVRIVTTMTNEGDAPAPGLALGDAIQWGGLVKLAPGKPEGFSGPARGAWVGGRGRASSLALVPIAGDISSTSGGGWTDITPAELAPLAPRETRRFERAIAVGRRADDAALVAEARALAGAPLGALALSLESSPGGAPHLGAVSLVARERASGASFRVALAAGSPSALVELAPGTWDVAEARGPLSSRSTNCVVAPGAAAPCAVTIAEPATLHVRLRDASRPDAKMPGKLTLLAPAGEPPVDFGPPGASGPARNVVTIGAEGEASVELAPGTLRLVASRGPEWSIDDRTLALEPGARLDLDVTLARVVDTDGYVGCDFHQHSAISIDSAVTDAERVVSNLAEGLGCAVASEHDVVHSVGDARDVASVPFHSIPGVEISTDTSKTPFGHLNVFPLEPAPDAGLHAGAPRSRDRLVADVLAEVHARSPLPVVQVNHPRSGKTGYFDLYGFDAATGRATKQGWDDGFDAVEVWSGRFVASRARVIADWTALLLAGHPVAPTANTDTHGVVGREAGYPRTYVAVDDASAWTDADVARGVRRRDVVLTNGPFVRLRAGDARPGGLVAARGGRVRLDAHVERAPWVDATAVDFVVNGAVAASAPLGGAKRSARGAIVDDVSRVVAVHGDAFVYAVVRGERPLEPVLAGEAESIRPWAMTGPIWVDGDGDGRSLGR